MIMRLIWFMDNTTAHIRGWREWLAADNAVAPDRRQAFSGVIEKYLVAAEKRGWVVGVESAKDYIELVEEAQGEGKRWEEGREGLRWLVKYGRRGRGKVRTGGC